MQSMRLELGVGSIGEGTLIEPFYDSPALDRELILGGQRYDGVETVTSYVYGDPAVYEPLLDDQSA